MNNYIESNKERFLEELFSLMRIPSVSSDPDRKDDMRKCADRWVELLLSSGADNATVLPTKGNPVVYGEKMISPELPTVLIYSHYDVMPAAPLELWKTSPFEPVVKDGKIWGRGADDDKGQAMIQAKAFETVVKNGELKCNVKFLFEGEEEIGSPSLEKFCIENKELLKSDIILVSDTGMVAEDVPSITTGLRGLCYWQIEVTGPSHDLHSGIYGGGVANPINELCKMIAQMTNSDGKITVPGFYDDVVNVSYEERKLMSKVPFDENKYMTELNVKALTGEKGYSTTERTTIRPSFDVCGIWGGYTQDGAKTVLPSKAYAKISTRIVPGQDSEKIAKLVADYIKKVAPQYIDVKVEYLHGGESYLCPIDLPAYKAAEAAVEKVFNKKPVPVRRGGSIPIVASFEKILGVKSILLGFGLESDDIHAPNENFQVSMFEKGIKTVVEFYKEFSK